MNRGALLALGPWLGIAGCGLTPIAESRAAPASLTIDDIVARCTAAYRRLDTLTARGHLRDERHGPNPSIPIRWDLARPGRGRLELGDDAIVVSGDQWWSYRAETGRVFRHRSFTRTPIETAANLMTDGAPMPLAALWERGESAFYGAQRREGLPPWRLDGVAWRALRPCYLLSQRVVGQDGARLVRLWIDQDSWLLRGWRLSAETGGDREISLLECTLDELAPNARLPSDRFQLKPPPRRDGPRPVPQPSQRRPSADR